MSQILGWTLLAALALAMPTISLAANPPAPLPNFIVINIDDLGYADIGPFGSTINTTPAIDRMAAEGKKLTSFYAAPICSPSRAALMTGCYAKRVLPIPRVLFPVAAVGLAPGEITIADVLHRRGYATACIGKWHLGDQPAFLPTQQGFDSYYGIPYSNDMGPLADGTKSNLGTPIPKPKQRRKGGPQLNKNGTGIDGMFQPPLPWLDNERVVFRVRQAEQQANVKLLTERSVAFIESNARQGKTNRRPFFLYLPHSAVHFPLYPGKEFQGRSTHGLYSDWVEELDWSVGQVLDAVDRAGISEQTLVIFTSDNGGTTRGNNGPLRGHKSSVWEGGVRVCTLCWWPGTIPAGSTSDAITGMHDILPTLAALAGAKLPADRVLDGRDISGVLQAADGGDPVAAAGPHDSFLYFLGLDLEAVRKGSWKLRLDDGTLYNLATDLGEKSDVAANHPDIVAELRALAAAADADLGQTGIGPGCRPLGRVKNPQPLIPFDNPPKP